jgi:hypothetical protein
MNTNDAFSAFRLGSYNNFLRLKIMGDTIDVYAIGLTDVPNRNEWQPNPKSTRANSDEPVFIPTVPLAPHLIEKVEVRPTK